MSLPIGLQLYSVKDSIAADFRGTLEKIKEMGYDGVEFAGLYGNEPADIKRWCEELGLVPISAHVPYPEMLKDPKGVLSVYREIGCKYVAIPGLEEAHRPGSAGFGQTLRNIKILGEAARELGIKLLYHHHYCEFIVIGGKYGLDIIYESVPSELLSAELDTCWVDIGGENPVTYINKYKGRVPVVHLKDYVGTKDNSMYEFFGTERKAPDVPSDFEFRPVGSGVQDMPAIIGAAKAAGAEWLMVEVEQNSLLSDKSPLDEVKDSIDYLRQLDF